MKIDTKLLKENFTKHYGKDETGLKCYKSCCGVVLYGAGLENSGLCIGGLSLSIDTNVLIKEKADKEFHIICADKNILYESNTEKLNSFTGDKLPKALFNACAMLKGKMNGADILIEYSVLDKIFKRPLLSLITGLGILNNGKVPDLETVKYMLEKTDEKSYSFLPAELYGRKNTLVSRKNDGSWEYLPFNLTGYKIVLSYIDKKGIDISEKLTQKYVANEKKRAEQIRKEIINNNSITEEIGKLMKESAYELFKLLGKNGEELAKMYKISEETNITSAIVPVYSIYGICAFVKDEDVDGYSEMISKEYQKKVGTTPTLCICDSDDSGVEI